MKTRTVVYLHPHFTIAGGAGTYVLQTGKLLSEKGYRVIVVCSRADLAIVGDYSGSIDFIELGGAISSELRFWISFPLTAAKIFRILNTINPDIVFPQVFPANWWGFLYKLFNPNRKVIWMCQEPSAFIHSDAWINALKENHMKLLVKAFRPILRFLDRYLARNVDLTFVNSKYGKQYAQDIYSYPSESIVVTYLGVDNSKFYLLPEVQRKRQIVTVGRLTKFKNIDIVVAALALLKERGRSDLTLQVIGKGEEEENLKGLVQSRGLGSSVNFLGAVTDAELVNTIRESRASVLSSVNEPFGLVAVEAMACGTPAIVVSSGGPSETVLDSQSGFHVPALDSRALADKIELLAYDDECFTKLSTGAVLRSKEFRWERTVDQIEENFQKLLESDISVESLMPEDSRIHG